MNRYATEEHFDLAMQGIDARFDGLKYEFVTKDEFHSRLDEVITILKRLDQERIFTIEWIRRIESDVSMVKKHLKLA